MENLNLEKFSPEKAELTLLVQDYKNITINGVDDKEGYKKANEARIILKKTRVEIEKTGTMLRADALAFQKAVIKKEKELIALIEPTELELEEKQRFIDEEKEKIKRQGLLPDRQTKLQEISVSIDDDFILLMDDTKFLDFYNQKKTEYLEEKERRIEAEKQKLQEQQEAQEREKQRQIELEQAKKQAEEKALKDAELAKIKAEQDKRAAIQAEREKAEAEKKALIEEQERKERERLAAIELKAQQEKEEAEKLEKSKKYQAFLEKNGYSEKTKDDFYIQQNGNLITIFQKLDEIKI